MSTSPAAKTRAADRYGKQEMTTLLRNAAVVEGSYTMLAATHLLTFTELPGRRDFARHVRIAPGWTSDGSKVTCALIRDWEALLGPGSGVYLTGCDRRMLMIAASYATGRPVDLSEHGGGLGSAGARRLVEAVALGTGMARYLTIGGTPALAELHAAQAALSGGTPAPSSPEAGTSAEEHADEPV